MTKRLFIAIYAVYAVATILGAVYVYATSY